MNRDVMFSTGYGEHETPAELVADLATVFEWDADVCAQRNNVCDTYYTPEDDALSMNWHGKLNWMNPPYGRGIRKWMEHAAHQSMHGPAIVSLVPARTDTAWWHDAIEIASHVTFIKGRLQFGTAEYWSGAFQERIMRESATPKQLNVLVRKLGGGVAEIITRQKVADMWRKINDYKPLPFALEDWYTFDTVRKDSAPFPSAFVVFGRITSEQELKLSSYGWNAMPQVESRSFKRLTDAMARIFS